MTRFASNTLAAFVAVIITATSLSAITTVPAEPQVAIAATTILA
ncbi:hypothetical protein [Erythrobacter alti]